MAGDEATTGSTTAVGMEGSANPHAACDAEIAGLRGTLTEREAQLERALDEAPGHGECVVLRDDLRAALDRVGALQWGVMQRLRKAAGEWS